MSPPGETKAKGLKMGSLPNSTPLVVVFITKTNINTALFTKKSEGHSVRLQGRATKGVFKGRALGKASGNTTNPARYAARKCPFMSKHDVPGYRAEACQADSMRAAMTATRLRWVIWRSRNVRERRACRNFLCFRVTSKFTTSRTERRCPYQLVWLPGSHPLQNDARYITKIVGRINQYLQVLLHMTVSDPTENAEASEGVDERKWRNRA